MFKVEVLNPLPQRRRSLGHDGLRYGGMFRGEVFSRSTGRLLRSWRDDPGLIIVNGITNQGIMDNQSAAFCAGTQHTQWFMGLVDNASWTDFLPGDTAASHSTWIECTAYDEATRPQWIPGAPAGNVVTNPTSVTFTMNATKTVKGAFIVSVSGKGATTGVLWSEGPFNSLQSLVDDQLLKLSYTLTGSSAS